MLKKILRPITIVILAVLLAGLICLLLWFYAENPAQFLPQPMHQLEANAAQPVIEQGRKIEHITFSAGVLGTIGIVVSLPDPLPAGKLPIVIVLGGLGTGENNIRFITDAGNNAIVGYDWPVPVYFPVGADFVRQLPALYSAVMTIPAQIASAIDWLAAEPWADDSRISILGFSLGALAAPAVENLTEQDGHKIDCTILAYGGAPLGALFAANPHMRPAWMRFALAPVIDLLLHPIEPSANLPHLSGHFLVLEGRDDRLIPKAARARLRNAVPEPKDVITFEGAHMGVGPDKMLLLQEIISASKQWLADNGAVNKPN